MVALACLVVTSLDLLKTLGFLFYTVNFLKLITQTRSLIWNTPFSWLTGSETQRVLRTEEETDQRHRQVDFPRYNMTCSRGNVILRGIFHVVSGFPLHFMLYRGNLDNFTNSVAVKVKQRRETRVWFLTGLTEWSCWWLRWCGLIGLKYTYTSS